MEACPRCKTTKYQNPSLVLMINYCGHSLCKKCVELLFVKGSGNCIECSAPLRRTDFRLQLFENNLVEKEVNIRKKILRDYYKTEEDFSSLKEYNDYLEEVETIIYNLTHNINAEETGKKVEQYRKDHKDMVLRNKMQYSKMLENLLEESKQEQYKNIYKRREMAKIEDVEKKRKIIEKEALITELSCSEKKAESILNLFTEAKAESLLNEGKLETELTLSELPNKTSYFSTGVKISNPLDIYRQIPQFEVGPIFIYRSPKIIFEGPKFPTCKEVEHKGYLHFYMRRETALERAGGFNLASACQRSLQEAMVGLYHVPKKKQPVVKVSEPQKSE